MSKAPNEKKGIIPVEENYFFNQWFEGVHREFSDFYGFTYYVTDFPEIDWMSFRRFDNAREIMASNNWCIECFSYHDGDHELCNDCLKKHVPVTPSEDWYNVIWRDGLPFSEFLEMTVLDLRTMSYAEYLKSSHWIEVRSEALLRAHYRCQLCNASDNLHVHHRTYARRGYEKIEDLTVLCSDCHQLFHKHRSLGGEE